MLFSKVVHLVIRHGCFPLLFAPYSLRRITIKLHMIQLHMICYDVVFF